MFDNFAFDEVLSYGNLGVAPAEAKEIVYQAVPYCGIGKVLGFIHATNEILERRGVKLPLEVHYISRDTAREGLGSAEGYLRRLLHQERTRFKDARTPAILDDPCFGRLRTTAKGHIQGNVNVGDDKETLLSVVTQLLPHIGYPRALNAIRCMNEVIPEIK